MGAVLHSAPKERQQPARLRQPPSLPLATSSVCGVVGPAPTGFSAARVASGFPTEPRLRSQADAHESSTQQTQERHEEEAQGGGVEQQSTRVSMAGAAAEQEESRHEGTRNGEGTQEQTQDGHAGSSAHERT